MLDGALVARLGARVGGTVRLTGPDGLRSWRVSGIADPPREPPCQYAVFHSPREAQRLAGSEQPVRALGVLAQVGGGGLPGHPRRWRWRWRWHRGRLGVRRGRPLRAAAPDGDQPVHALSVVNTLSTATAGRRREFGLLRPADAQSAQVVRTPAWEAVLTCAVALLPTAVVCGPVLVPLSIALTGSAVPALARGPLTALTAGALVLTAGTVTLAGLLALRSAAAAPGGPARTVS